MEEDDAPLGLVVAGMDLLSADESSLALVATLLAEEIQAQLDAKLAIRLQMTYTVDCNQNEGRGSPCSDFDMLKDSDEEESDELISLRQQLDMINSTLSKGTIVDLAGADRNLMSDSIRARQLNQQMEARAKKERLDHEFAQALQNADDVGQDSDALSQRGLEATLGEGYVQNVMVSPGFPSLISSTGTDQSFYYSAHPLPRRVFQWTKTVCRWRRER